MPAAVALDELVEVAKALGHPARLRMLAMLRQGELCVCQLTSVLDLSGSTVSAHLSDLRRAGLVTEEKRGKWVFYRSTEEESLARVVGDVLRLVERDPQVREDARVVQAVRNVPVDDLCRAGLDLVAVGVKPLDEERRARGRGATHVD